MLPALNATSATGWMGGYSGTILEGDMYIGVAHCELAWGLNRCTKMKMEQGPTPLEMVDTAWGEGLDPTWLETTWEWPRHFKGLNPEYENRASKKARISVRKIFIYPLQTSRDCILSKMSEPLASEGILCHKMKPIIGVGNSWLWGKGITTTKRDSCRWETKKKKCRAYSSSIWESSGTMLMLVSPWPLIEELTEATLQNHDAATWDM